jgi:hypothetical protein
MKPYIENVAGGEIMTRDKAGDIRYTLRDSGCRLILKFDGEYEAWERGLRVVRNYAADEDKRPDLWLERRVGWSGWTMEKYFSWLPLEDGTEGAFFEYGFRHQLHAIYIGTPLRRIDAKDAPSSLLVLGTSTYNNLVEDELKAFEGEIC